MKTRIKIIEYNSGKKIIVAQVRENVLLLAWKDWFNKTFSKNIVAGIALFPFLIILSIVLLIISLCIYEDLDSFNNEDEAKRYILNLHSQHHYEKEQKKLEKFNSKIKKTTIIKYP